MLACLEGKEIQHVAAELKVSIPTAGKWRRRFAAQGLDGLRDHPRPGKPPVYGKAFRDRVLALSELPPPAGLAHWDGPTIAEQLRASTHAVWRTLQREDFRRFLDAVIDELPAEKEIQVILDNYSSHKENGDWLVKFEGRVHFHFNPTSASWLNQVEIWFGLLTRKALRGASFSSKGSVALGDRVSRRQDQCEPKAVSLA